MLKFCQLVFHVDNFFRRYQSWVQYQNLVGTHEPAAKVSGFDNDAIRVYRPWEADRIELDQRTVVALDLKEGLREIAMANQRLPKNKHYIIFCGSYPGIRQVNIELDHTLIFHEFLLASMIELHMSPQSPFFYTNRLYNFGEQKAMQFVHFANVPRSHRVVFAQWLSELPDKNWIFRLDGKDYGVEANKLDDVDYTVTSAGLSQWFEQSAKHITNPHLHIMGRIPVRMMSQARYNLVLESDFEMETLSTTEKTLRPLLLGMPFVLASGAGHLTRLQHFGFRTYHELWDESYDREPNHDKRLRKIFELVQQLYKFDWNSHQTQLLEIGRHNQANFLQLGWHFDQEFRNFEAALLQSPAASLIYEPK